MSFSSNIALWLGSTPNALQAGRVDCYVGANNDKTGYSLTAGSYSSRASSTQLAQGNIINAATTANATISAVTLVRAILSGSCALVAATAVVDGLITNEFTTTTNVRFTRGGTGNTATGLAHVLELF